MKTSFDKPFIKNWYCNLPSDHENSLKSYPLSIKMLKTKKIDEEMDKIEFSGFEYIWSKD